MTIAENVIVFPGPAIPTVRPAWPKGALTRKEAAEYLSVGITTLWKLTASGKIKRTSYGTYTIEELNRHLKEEMETV